MHEEQEILGYFQSKDGESIKVLALDETVIDNEDEIFIKLDYKGEEHNVLLQSEVFPIGESPYESGDITNVPYFVIENYVYYLDDAYEINKDLEE